MWHCLTVDRLLSREAVVQLILLFLPGKISMAHSFMSVLDKVQEQLRNVNTSKMDQAGSSLSVLVWLAEGDDITTGGFAGLSFEGSAGLVCSMRHPGPRSMVSAPLVSQPLLGISFFYLSDARHGKAPCPCVVFPSTLLSCGSSWDELQ